MKESIGECKCINSREKHYIVVALQKEIVETVAQVEDLRGIKQDEASEKIRKTTLAVADELEKRYLFDIKTTLEKVQNVPDCD